MDHQQMRDLAGDVAATLTAERGEPWQCTQADTPADGDYPGARLDGPAAARLQLRYGWQATGQVTVTGLFPDGQSTYTANINPARGPRTVAREAARRVLDAGYLDELPAVLAKDRARRDTEAARVAMLRQAARITAGPGNWQPDHPRDRVELGHLLPDTGYGEVTAHWAGSDRLGLQLTAVPAATMLRLLAVLAEDAGGQPAATCACCTANECECAGTRLDRRPDPAQETTHA